MQCDRAMTATNATTSEASQVKVLVVDDEIVLADLLASALRYEGWEVTTAHTGADAVRLAREISPDLVVLDIMLPDFDGLEVLSKIRRNDPDISVLFLTAKDSIADRVEGLSAGGDDYVTKPFSLEEVVARLHALLRRSGSVVAPPSNELVVGDLRMDEDSHAVKTQLNSPPPSLSCCVSSWKTRAGCCLSRKSWTGYGTTTLAAKLTWWSFTSPTCVARSIRDARP